MKNLHPVFSVIFSFMLLVVVLTAVFIIAFTFSGCVKNTGPAKVYNVENYPGSYIIQSFEASGINPEAFARRIASIIKIEIMQGKFTRAEVLGYIEDLKGDVMRFELKYSDIPDLLCREKKMYNTKGTNITEAAMVILTLLDFNIDDYFNSANAITKEDMVVVLSFLKYLEKTL